MKIIYIFLICLLSGCATPIDMPTVALLINRVDKLEKQVKTETTPRAVEPSEGRPNRLNDAQKDFVRYMLDYLADEED